MSIGVVLMPQLLTTYNCDNNGAPHHPQLLGASETTIDFLLQRPWELVAPTWWAVQWQKRLMFFCIELTLRNSLIFLSHMWGYDRLSKSGSYHNIYRSISASEAFFNISTVFRPFNVFTSFSSSWKSIFHHGALHLGSEPKTGCIFASCFVVDSCRHLWWCWMSMDRSSICTWNLPMICCCPDWIVRIVWVTTTLSPSQFANDPIFLLTAGGTFFQPLVLHSIFTAGDDYLCWKLLIWSLWDLPRATPAVRGIHDQPSSQAWQLEDLPGKQPNLEPATPAVLERKNIKANELSDTCKVVH